MTIIYEDNGVPLEQRQVLVPFCTCYSGKGYGHIDEKGRILCQLHNAQEKYEAESRALGGLDNFPRV